VFPSSCGLEPTARYTTLYILYGASSVMNFENRRKRCRGRRLMYIVRRRLRDTRIIQGGDGDGARGGQSSSSSSSSSPLRRPAGGGSGFIATIFLASSSPSGHVFGDKSTLRRPAVAGLKNHTKSGTGARL